MITNITVSYNKKEGKIQVLEAEDSEEKKETVIAEKEILRYVFEVNLEAFVYYQQFDYTYCLYLLRKIDKVLSVSLNSDTFRSM
jgi:hypothetical protein